jgi:hypothetical protein
VSLLSCIGADVAIALRVMDGLGKRACCHVNLRVNSVVEGGNANYFFITAIQGPIVPLLMLVECSLMPKVQRTYEVLKLFITLTKLVPIRSFS